jgi:lipopolysaccharide transport system ATP-binding protein
MNDVLIKVENVSKRFCRNLKRSLWYGLQDLSSEIGGRRHGGGSELPQGSSDMQLRRDEFWAVKDVSFELRRGECLGLVGRNGAGKTTLLRMLNGLIKPDAGKISIKGKMGALIALGAGFNEVLTGRENIYVNGSMLGLDKKTIEAKLDEIIDFSGLEEFIDAPVQSYSSGMSVRLGFATAAVMIEPDILILDEVLAVGDLGFRYKCFSRVGQLVKNAAVILVSHDMPSVARMATRAMLMSDGQIERVGSDAPSIIQSYNEKFASGSFFKKESGEAIVSDICVYSEANSRPKQLVSYGEDVAIKFAIKWLECDPNAIITVNILDKGDTAVAQMESNNHNFKLAAQSSKQLIKLVIPRLPLAPGEYRLWIVITSPGKNKHIAVHYGVAQFTVTGSFIGYIPFQPIPTWSSSPL